MACIGLALRDVERHDLSGHGIGTIIREEAPSLVREEIVATTYGDIPGRIALTALLRDYLNYAIGRFSSIQRCGGWTLHNLDTFDVIRIEVVPARGGARA